MKEESFISILSALSPQEINQLIEEKGKQPKKITIWFPLKGDLKNGKVFNEKTE